MVNELDDCTPVDVLNILEPGQLESVDDLLERGKTQPIAWAWDLTFREGMTISFGVNRYDCDFFRDAFMEPKHAAYYRRLGAVPEDFDIEHFVEGDSGFDEIVRHRESLANAGVPGL